MTQQQSPDDIRRDIERTRYELANDVDTLHEKVSPKAVASRRVDSAKGAMSGLKEKVMGSSSGGHSASSTMHSGLDSTKGAVSSAGSAVTSAPTAATSRTQGNPLAAGLIAFGAGWLASSLLPSSEKEQHATMAAKDKVSEHSDTLTAPAKEAAQGMKENLQPKAQQAAESLKSTATDAAQTVKGEAASAKDDVAGQAQHAKDEVRGGGQGETVDLNQPVGSEHRTGPTTPGY